ncbi:MAG TPA: NAD(P)H-dependent oxidoreductase subunit E [Bacillota bacterium]|nr:NAD(P)H-dependent oxidoreductase subunit E [Bacillota bacterium]
MVRHGGDGPGKRGIEQLRGIFAGFGNKREALIPCLAASQRMQRSITRGTAAFLAGETGSSLAEVYGVATFYHLLTEKPLGRNVIRVCDCLACHVKGGPEVLKAIEEELGIKAGQTTKDGLVSLVESPCMGLCDIAPAVMVNDEAYGDLTPGRARDVARAARLGVMPKYARCGKQAPGGIGSKVVP